ncbi:MAG: tRNA (N(6)-L-threonylcarbamoyladenosine(37)-C(2))-methylthiotransferase MtaB [Chitinophagales bacterium]
MERGSVAFYTLGCKLNYSESSTLSRLMKEEGYAIKPFHNAADFYVINTCSVTDHADKKCRKVVQQALKKSPMAKVIIVGCYAQLKPEEIANMEGVDLVLGAAEKFNLVKHINELSEKTSVAKKGKFISGDIAEVNIFNAAYSMGERTRTFLKVQDGCDYSCSFCTIPLARGGSRSNTIENVISNVQDIARQGVSEIVLTGVNIGDFGKLSSAENEETFFELISELDKIENIGRFRISSIEPNLLSPEIIEFVSSSKRFAPHFHIPLQSGSNKILRLMRRRYLRELYADRIEKIKTSMPHCCIGVDVITGFPGETHEDFLETYNFLNELDISYLHVFTYSERANTHAIELPGVVPQNIRQQRTTQLRNLSEKKRRYFYNQFTGTKRVVLFEEETDGEFMYGFTDNYIKVKTAYDPLLVNEKVFVTLYEVNAEGDMVAGEIHDEVATTFIHQEINF